MTDRNRRRSEEITGAIDAALTDNPVLSRQQLEAVRELRREAQEMCRAGRLGDARDCEKRAVAIVKQGAPAPE
jgi:hypothetical protein